MNALFRAVGLSKQAYHQQAKRAAAFETQKQALFLQVDAYRSHHAGCGVAKLYDTLNPSWLGRDRFCDLLLSSGYRIRHKPNYTKTTISAESGYQNLIEGMLLCGKDQVWQSDITYYWLGHTFGYIVFIVDIYTKRIVGFSANDNMRAEANVRSLAMALRLRGGKVAGLIHHSDKGGQYIYKKYLKMLGDNGAHVSMGLLATDNAYAERVNGIIKNEYLAYWEINTLEALRRGVTRAVKHYNTQRIHRSLPNHSTPVQFEKELLALPSQKRPKVIVYSEGNRTIRNTANREGYWQEQLLYTPACPIVTLS